MGPVAGLHGVPGRHLNQRGDQGADDRLAVVTSLHSLLRITECRALRDLSDRIEDRLEPAYVEVTGIGRFACEGIEVRVHDRGACLHYPFPIAELWSYVADLEAEYNFENACGELEYEIEQVEGIRVCVSIDHSCDVSLLKAKHRRRCLDTGVEVQAVPRYPYRRALSRTGTWDEWEADRFRRNFPGLDVWPVAPDRSVIRGDMRLLDLRSDA